MKVHDNELVKVPEGLLVKAKEQILKSVQLEEQKAGHYAEMRMCKAAAEQRAKELAELEVLKAATARRHEKLTTIQRNSVERQYGQIMADLNVCNARAAAGSGFDKTTLKVAEAMLGAIPEYQDVLKEMGEVYELLLKIEKKEKFLLGQKQELLDIADEQFKYASDVLKEINALEEAFNVA